MQNTEMKIVGRSDINKPWGTIDAMRGANAEMTGKPDALTMFAFNKVNEWRRASNDMEGTFRDWMFKVVRLEGYDRQTGLPIYADVLS